jgi:hypothetical protein
MADQNNKSRGVISILEDNIVITGRLFVVLFTALLAIGILCGYIGAKKEGVKITSNDAKVIKETIDNYGESAIIKKDGYGNISITVK